MARTLTRPEIDKGLLAYTDATGASTYFAMRHIVSYTDLPGNEVSVVTTGGQKILSFGNTTDKAAAMVLLDASLK